MVITPAVLNRIYQNVRKDFEGAFSGVPRLWKEWGWEVPSTSRSNLYRWLSDVPQVTEFIGPRTAKSLGLRAWEVVNRNWKNDIELDRYQLEDDTDGAISDAQQKALSLGEEYGYHEDRLLAETLEAGWSVDCYDGQPYFDTAHPIDIDDSASAVQSNKMTGSALSMATFETAVERFHGFKRENGLPLAPPTKLLLVGPPALRSKMKHICESEYLTSAVAWGLAGTSGMTQNTEKGTATFQVNPYLTSTTKWYLFNVGMRIRAVGLQRRQAPRLVRKDQPTDDNVVERNALGYFTDARYAGFVTFPHLCIGADA